MSLTGRNDEEDRHQEDRLLAIENHEKEQEDQSTIQALRAAAAPDISRDDGFFLHPVLRSAVASTSSSGPNAPVNDNTKRRSLTRRTDGSPKSSRSQVAPNLQGPVDHSRSPSRLSRVRSRVTGATKSLLTGRTGSNKSISPTQSTQNIIYEPYEYTSSPYAPQGLPNPAPNDPEVAILLEEFNRWDEQTHIVDPALWQRRVRLRHFRLFQRKKRRGDGSHGTEIKQGNAYTGNCLADAELFLRRSDVDEVDIVVLGDGDRDVYREMYGFTPAEVMAIRGIGIVIDAINKSGTLAAQENMIDHYLANIRFMVRRLYSRLTSSVLQDQHERIYSKVVLKEALALKRIIDTEFERLERQSANMRNQRVNEDAELVIIGQERRRDLLRIGSAASHASLQYVDPDPAGSIQARRRWEADHD